MNIVSPVAVAAVPKANRIANLRVTTDLNQLVVVVVQMVTALMPTVVVKLVYLGRLLLLVYV